MIWASHPCDFKRPSKKHAQKIIIIIANMVGAIARRASYIRAVRSVLAGWY